ncbi:hypothetical protein ACFQV8_27675 [Pseudonocardia benzenivorans]
MERGLVQQSGDDVLGREHELHERLELGGVVGDQLDDVVADGDEHRPPVPLDDPADGRDPRPRAAVTLVDDLVPQAGPARRGRRVVRQTDEGEALAAQRTGDTEPRGGLGPGDEHDGAVGERHPAILDHPAQLRPGGVEARQRSRSVANRTARLPVRAGQCPTGGDPSAERVATGWRTATVW